MFLAGADCDKVPRTWAHFRAPALRPFDDAFSALALLGCCACVTLRRNHAVITRWPNRLEKDRAAGIRQHANW